jgi:hypothetical protein
MRVRRPAAALAMAAVVALLAWPLARPAAQTVTGFASTMQALTAIYNQLAGTLTVSGALAPSPVNSAGNYSGASVGTSPATIVAALSSGSRYLVDIINLSSSATVCLSLGGAASISGSTCAAGEVPLAPGGRTTWPSGGSSFVPGDAITAIASSSGVPLTIGVK